MDWELLANRNGHIACTQGGETLAGLAKAVALGIVERNALAIIDSTAHALKFSGFQEMYFENSFPPEFEVIPKDELVNYPVLIRPDDLKKYPEAGSPLTGDDMGVFVSRMSEEIAKTLDLKKMK
jgi:threonine synthase